MCTKTDPNGNYSKYFYYSFDYDGNHFIILKVNFDYFSLLACNSPWLNCETYCKDQSNIPGKYGTCYNAHQYDWLISDLKNATSNPTLKHIFVFAHAPIYTSSWNHPPSSSSEALKELFDEYNVSIFFNGHNADYERTYPIKQGTIDNSGT